jgi:mono/diheme cytochrome c family protein
MTRLPSPRLALVLALVLPGGAALGARADADDAPPPPPPAAPASPTAAPTFYRDVLPVLQQRCQVCHHAGGAGPFALETLADAEKNAPMIAEVVETGRMPPWQADPAVGHFANARVLPPAEKQLLLDWTANLKPGDEKDAPPPRAWPSGWALGEPDAIVSLPRVMHVPARGVVDYVYTDVPTEFGEDKWLKAWQVRSSSPTVVHHVLVFVKYPSGAGQPPNFRGGLDGYFASALPGDQVLPFAQGTARRLPRGTTLVFQVHYTPDGTARDNQVQMALWFAKKDEPIEREARTVALNNTHFQIMPNAKGQEVRARYTFQSDVILYGLTPHMHVRGESFRYLLMMPDGTSRPLLNVPHYDFAWQNTYRLETPMFVPRGAKMVGLATFDNTSGNPANPDPNRTVYFGEQTTDEMMIGYMDTVAATPAERAEWERTQVVPLDPAGQ